MDKTNLLKRGHVWCVRVAIPRHLQDTLGKREYVRSLKTTSLAEANKRKPAVIAEFRKLIELAEKTSGRTKATPTDKLLADLRTLTRQQRMKLLSDADVDLMKDTLVDRAHDLSETSQIPEDMAARIKSAVGAVDGSILPLSEAVGLYLDHHKPPAVTQQTYNAKEKRLAELVAFLGPDTELAQVNGKLASRYITEDILKRDLAAKTKADVIIQLSAFFAWCELQDWIPGNPFRGKSKLIRTSKRGTADKAKPRPWTTDELLKFAKGAPATDSYHLLTLFILGLYTGARLNELAGLKLEHVYKNRIHVAESKTPAGVRDIPLHPLLVPLVQHLKKTSSDVYLLPGLVGAGEDNKRGHTASKQFTRLRRKLGVTEPGVRFHSLRANFITALEQARVPVNEIQLLVGHKRPSLALDVYSGGQEFKRLQADVRGATYGKRVDRLVSERIVELTGGKSGG